jgi:hypothetical protein
MCPELGAKATQHQNRLVSTFHSMMHIMEWKVAMEDEAKRKLHWHAGGVAARLTAEELEKVFGGDKGAAWVPTTGTKGRRSFQDWILRTQELCKKALVKTKQPDAVDIVHCAIGATAHNQGLSTSGYRNLSVQKKWSCLYNFPRTTLFLDSLFELCSHIECL